MTDILGQIVAFIGDNPSLAGLICFIVAMGEALFIIGLVVPSTVVLVGAGTLVGLGKLDGVSIFIWTALGATAGDAVSYWFGHFYKDKVRRLWPLSRYSSLMDRGEEFFRAHGGKSIFIGRFVPGVKSVVPGIAGMVGMNATRFTVINVTSAIFWTAAHLGPGILAGTALEAIGQISTRLAFVIGGLCVILFIAVMLGRWLILIILPLFPGAHAAIVNWFGKRPGKMSQWIAVTFDPAHPRSIGMLVSALLLLITMPAFFFFIGEIAPGEPMVRADVAILNLFSSVRTPIGDTIMVFFTSLGDGVVVTFVTVAVALYLFLRRAWRRATGFLIAIGSTAIFVPLIKALLERSRPIALYSGADSFSFPSGHATLNAVLFGICAVLIAHERNRWIKAAIFSITAAYVITIGFSRVYLAAHWMSDVLAGFLFGLAIVSAFAFVFGPIHNEKIGRNTLAALVVGCLTLFGGWHVIANLDKAVEIYEPRNRFQILTASEWHATGWKELPQNRIELSGGTKEPLVIQYAGDPARLAPVLTPHGWSPPPKWSLSTASGFVEGKTPADKLPILPRTQNGRSPALVLIRKDETADPSGGRWVLRLWPSRFEILTDGTLKRLYVGSILHEAILRPMGEFSGPKMDREAPALSTNPARLLPDALVRQWPDGREVVLCQEPPALIAPTKPKTTGTPEAISPAN
ncbi:bifunctional DedA family/phosphatase PAP2 family protein [Roseibium aggregatum]|nr:bifunctional DedA family/phosphatase PAP2 family protein [Roseibium aggregatum]